MQSVKWGQQDLNPHLSVWSRPYSQVIRCPLNTAKQHHSEFKLTGNHRRVTGRTKPPNNPVLFFHSLDFFFKTLIFQRLQYHHSC